MDIRMRSILVSLATAAALCMQPPAASAADLYRTNSAGTWTDGLWTDSGLSLYAQPTAADSAFIGCDQATPPAALAATVTVTSAGAAVSNLYVGRSLDTSNNGEAGTLILDDNTSLSAANLSFGQYARYGKGHLSLGNNATIDVTDDLTISYSSLSFNGDQVQVGRDLYLGRAYNLYLTSKLVLTGGAMHVGGTFNLGKEIRQTAILLLTNGAALNVGGSFAIGDAASGSNGRTYDLTLAPGAALNVTNDFIFWCDSMAFNGDGIDVGGRIRVGGRTGGNDHAVYLAQNGGSLVAGGLTVQDLYFRIKYCEHRLTNNATLSLRRPAGGTVENIVGKSGSDRNNRTYCILGDASSAGTIEVAASGGSGTHSLTIYDEGPTTFQINSQDMALLGWGRVDLDGTLQNNGKIIADGHGGERDLVLTNFSAVAQDETHWTHVKYGFQFSDGSKPGWYARNGGRLLLPPLTGIAGTMTNRWGDTSDDLALNTNDLVNSVMLAFDNVTGGDVSISLLATNRTDSRVLYPDTVLGVWSVDCSAFTFGSGSAALTFRYDHVLAQGAGLNEADVKVWSYNNGWRDATAAVDTTSKTVTAQPLNASALLALSTGLPGEPPPLGTLISIR